MTTKSHIDRAFELAGILNDHCKRYDLPKELVLDGVAVNAEAFMKSVTSKGYQLTLQKTVEEICQQ